MSKNKIIYSLGLITSITTPLAFISARLDDPKPPVNPGNNKPEEKPKTTDPNFATFKEKNNKKIAETIDKSIELITSFLKDQILKNKSDTETDYQTRLSRQIYLEKLLEFYETNKENIKKEPDKYGMYITFPYVLSREKNYINGTVEFNNKQYENIIYGKGDDKLTKYDRAIDPSKIKKVAEELNIVDEKRFESAIEKYTGSLLEEIKSIALDDSDILKIGKDYDFVNKKANVDGKQQTILTVQNPKGYKNWDEYIIDKFKTRFIEFDLRQNQEFIIEEPTPTQPQDIPYIPPLVPNKPVKVLPVETKLESLPILSPLVRAEYSTNSIENLNILASQKLKDVFFFNNPINTKYQYEVQEITQNSAKVAIYDKEKPNLKRTYVTEFSLESNQDTYKQEILYNQIKAINDIALKFYDSLGLDEHLKYEKLANQVLINTVFGLVDQFTKTIYSLNYIIYQNERIEKLTEDYRNSKISIDEAYRDSANTFLTAIASSKFNGVGSWNAVPNAYNHLINVYKVDVLRHNKDVIFKNIENMKQYAEKINSDQLQYNSNTIEQFVDVINKRIHKLKAVATVNNYTINEWFNGYVKLIGKIKENFLTMRTLAQPKEIKDEKSAIEFDLAYKKAQEEIKEQNNSVHKVQEIFGISIAVIGSLLILLTIILALVNIKKSKKYKLKTLYAVLTSLSLSLIIIGSILIFI
ncbi:Hypothetical protein, predicted transmembrane protein [Mycoplasmopsis bovigenitalium 51080]|uniref:Transmembrane protein n=1 Tax=Mycoplasmopsis bovigenitalium 51080 TaxID=1188235 RepID=N9TSA7_9BACT|nr:hypothetical protein [Mycoplasmopsis bovigenitalium]ENY69039.1 Hypothetical protein, predicted transmembrane protein [Mycoplasmopsis bovigenitalium 51080]